MASNWDLLSELNVKKLKELAKENNVSLVESGFFGDKRATKKDDIMNILSNSSKISKKKINDKISGKTTVKKQTTKKPKRMRILAHDRSVILDRQNKKCDKCGKDLNLIHRLYEIDHKEGLADGGVDSLENYHALCLECHRKKTRRETTARAKIKRQSSVDTKKPVKKKTVRKKPVYSCTANAGHRELWCGKKSASSSCKKTGLFDTRCEYLKETRE